MFMRNIFRVSGLLDKIKIAVTPELKTNLKFNRGQFFFWTTINSERPGDTNSYWRRSIAENSPAVEDHKRTICGEKTQYIRHEGKKVCALTNSEWSAQLSSDQDNLLN